MKQLEYLFHSETRNTMPKAKKRKLPIDILSVPKDGIIRERGAYSVPITHYHTQCCAGPSVSSSDIRNVELNSPMDFWATSDLNPDKFPGKDKAAFMFGRAAHALILGDEVFDDGYAVRPEEWDSWRTKDASQWRDENIALGKTVITPEDLITIQGMSEVLYDHPLVRPLFEGVPEISMFAEDAATKLWMKARPDMLMFDLDTDADLKTTADASLRACLRDIGKNGYDMQMAWCSMVRQVAIGSQPAHNLIVFTQKTPPFHVTPVEISADAIYWAKCRCRRGLDTIAKGLETGHWNGTVEGIPTFDVWPDTATRLAEEQIAGTLPNLGDI